MSRLAVEVIKDFIALDPETQPRNVTAWTPVVTDVLRGSIEFEEDQVSAASLSLASPSSSPLFVTSLQLSTSSSTIWPQEPWS
jgi:hypothetical protein